MNGATIRMVIVSGEAVVYGLLILLAIAVARVQSHRTPVLNKLIHVTLLSRIVALSSLVLGSVLLPSGQIAYGITFVAIGVALLIGGGVVWRLRQRTELN